MDNLSVEGVKKMISEKDILSTANIDELKQVLQKNNLTSHIPEVVRDKIFPSNSANTNMSNVDTQSMINTSINNQSINNTLEVKDPITASNNTVSDNASNNTVSDNASNNTIANNQIHSTISDVGSNNKLINQELTSSINNKVLSDTSFMSNNNINVIIQTTETITKNENSVDYEKTKKCCYIL